MNISEFVMSHEVQIRMVFFFSIFAVIAIWELIAPRRALTVSKPVRWVNNLGIVFFNSLVLRLLFPAAAVGMAAFAVRIGVPPKPHRYSRRPVLPMCTSSAMAWISGAAKDYRWNDKNIRVISISTGTA